MRSVINDLEQLREQADKRVARLERQVKALQIAVEALNEIASWMEGPEVTGRFDEPYSARVARASLEKIKDAIRDPVERPAVLCEVFIGPPLEPAPLDPED